MDKFMFGMYKGHDVNEVIKDNPSYVLWAENNVSYFHLTKDQHDACIQSIERDYYDRMELRERTWDNDYDEFDEISNEYEKDMRACFDPNY